MLVALGSLASVQTKATAKTKLVVTKFIDYAATHPFATIPSQASPLAVHRDESYL
jgi:hypothetical protein